MHSKHQNKKLPPEMLVDIFKSTDGAIIESLPNLYKIFSMLKQKEFEEMWTNYVNNLLTSSSIVYIFVGKSFKKRWIFAMEENELRVAKLDERFARLEEYRRQNEEIEEEIKNREIVMKAKLAQILKRREANFLFPFKIIMKSKNKKLPPEMLVDIFKSTDGAIMENLLPNLYKISSMSKQKEFEKLWISNVNALLTCSSIVSPFIQKFLKERWLFILEERNVRENIKETELIEAETLKIKEFILQLKEENGGERRTIEIIEETLGLKEKRFKILKRRISDWNKEKNCPIVKCPRSYFQLH
uniref:F-box domain-containing protein n=1 Tax=Meloidogyne floridensis TaxID=298350 RepID=A0A915PAB5_9BILA